MPLLDIQGLVVRHGAVEAVHGIDLVAESGELVSLIGANGAGKTSTLGAVAGIFQSRATALRFDNKSITRLAPEQIARMGIALCPEGRRVFSELTVVDNLRLGGAASLVRRQLFQRIETMFDRFPILGERRSQKAGSLSGGEQQMLAIARALMSSPRMLLLDEPSLGLAPQMVDRVFDLIEDLKRDGLTIVLVEQNVGLALEVADRGYVMANGRIVLSGTASDLANTDLVKKAYLAV